MFVYWKHNRKNKEEMKDELFWINEWIMKTHTLWTEVLLYAVILFIPTGKKSEHQ